MNHPVVVPLSPLLFTPRQIPQLREIARRSEADFRVVNLVSPDAMYSDRERAGKSSENELLARKLQTSRRNYLTSVIEQFEAVTGAARIRGDYREGDVVPVLCSYVREERAAMIVIGGDDDDRDGRETLARTGQELVRASGCSVFILFTTGNAARGTFLSPMDGSAEARAGFELALCAAHACGAEDLTLQAVSMELSGAEPNGSDQPPSRFPAPQP